MSFSEKNQGNTYITHSVRVLLAETWRSVQLSRDKLSLTITDLLSDQSCWMMVWAQLLQTLSRVLRMKLAVICKENKVPETSCFWCFLLNPSQATHCWAESTGPTKAILRSLTVGTPEQSDGGHFFGLWQRLSCSSSNKGADSGPDLVSRTFYNPVQLSQSNSPGISSTLLRLCWESKLSSIGTFRCDMLEEQDDLCNLNGLQVPSDRPPTKSKIREKSIGRYKEASNLRFVISPMNLLVFSP